MPQRIVALTEETTEWLYLLGQEDKLVGISAYTERPAHAKAEKPVVSAFIGGHIKKIKALKPDLIIGFSDVQAELARELISENLPVLITNQRSVQQIMDNMLMLGRMVGAEQKAQHWLDQCQAKIEAMRSAQQQIEIRPKVYFEEWDEPMISAIHWVSELIEIAGGENIFSDRAAGLASRERYVTVEEVQARAPEIFIGCWCGKALDEESVRQRVGFAEVPAIRERQIVEMDPAIILQPGPACLTDGLDALSNIVSEHLSKKSATL
ncbi:MAG: cobalamin-binding protein [Bacteroidia bacterium]